MFEFHGWATIRLTPENRERENEEKLLHNAVAQVESRINEYVSSRGWNYNPLVAMRRVNGEVLVQVEGFSNHEGTIAEDMRALFNFIAKVAPGSYGIVYALNDEDPVRDNMFRVFVLKRGEFVERADPFLSPFIPVVEDPYFDN